MKFEKYEKQGDYHWRQFYQGTKYKRHAIRIMNWVKEKNVLDIGAGDGMITFLIGASGIDNEPSGVKIAQEKGVKVILGDVYDIPSQDSCFEAVLMADVLEHLNNTHKALMEVRRVLKKDGVLYITTPPKRDDGQLTDKYHYVEWTPQELIELMKKEGFHLEGEILSIPEEKVMYAKFRKLHNRQPGDLAF